MRRDSVKAIADVDLHLRSPDALVGELSGGQRQGVAIAREMLSAVRGRVAGAYVMPPFERFELALEVVDGFLDRA